MAAAKSGCCRSKCKKRVRIENLLEIAIMPVQPPPVTTQQNQTQPVRPDISEPFDPGPAPATAEDVVLLREIRDSLKRP